MKKMYKLSWLLVLCVLISTVAYSQNVTVSGAVTGNGSYPTLETAFTALNSGAQGGANITVSIVGNTTEVTTAQLNTNNWNSVTISPSGGVLRSITGNIAAPLITLNGCSNVTFNGINAGGNQLQITNQNTGAANTIRFINDASSNVVTNCVISGCGATAGSSIINFSTGLLTGNDNNTISFNTIGGSVGGFLALNGILSLGTAGMENSGNSILNNNIFDIHAATALATSILVGANNTAWTLNNNRIYQSTAQNVTTANIYSSIQVTSGNGHTIQGNFIGYSTALGTGVMTYTSGVAARLIGINCAFTPGASNSIQNNTIASISLTTSSGAATTNGILCGINVTAGDAVINGNQIGANAGTGSIVATPTTTQGMVVGINSSSTGTVSITNNNMGAFTSSGVTAAVAGGISGINVSGVAASMTITGNIIGNTTPDNMRGGTLGLTTGNSVVSGMNLPSTPTGTTNISNNTVRNLASYGTGASGYVRGIWTAAATGSAATYNITGNTIHNLVTNSALPTLTSGQTCAVGINLSIGNNGNATQNTIHSISNIGTGTNASYVAGITSANATNSTINKNVIYNITNAGTSVTVTAPSVAAGIIIRSGTTNVHVNNNMISLGTGQNTNTAYLGIMCNHGSTPDPVNNLYYNTIHIEGSVASGAQPSFGIARTDFSATARTPVMNVMNNIITNNRSGGTGKHYAIANNYGAVTATATGWGANFSNYNVLNANAANIGYWTTDQTFAGWKAASASDANSYSNIPVTYVNNANNLHLNMNFPTPIESGGNPIPGITVDIDNDARPGPVGSVNGGGFAPDLGADEFDGFYADLIPPTISYTPLPFTCATGNRTLTASIADFSGVPTAGVNMPRIYYRKNGGAWFSSQGTLTTGNATNGTWTFTIIAADMGGVAIGDIITYYVIAQDISATPNIASNPAAGLVATDVNNVSSAPSTPNQYSINGTISGTYNVGVGQIYTTLSQAVNAYNTNCLNGPVTFLLTDANYPGETFPISILSNPTANAINTLTIKPTLAATSISGSSATGLIMLSGADYVTIDGSTGNVTNTVCPASNATRDLTITNTNAVATAAVIWIASPAGDSATHCTIKNTIISGATPTTTLAGIGSGGATAGSAGTNNNATSIINNDIRSCQFGVYCTGNNAGNKNQGLIINQNFLNNASPTQLGQGGVYVAFTNNAEISGNTIGNIINSTSGQEPYGINAGFAAVNGFSTTLTGLADGVSNVNISYNTIGTIQQTVTFSAMGIALGNTVSGTSLIANNMISGVGSNATSPDFCAGILVAGGTGIANVYHNTVAMQGTISGATAGTMTSACFASTSATSSPINVLNNIFANTQSGNAGASTRFTAMALVNASPYTNLVSNNNDLYAAGAGPGVYTTGITGGIIGTNRLTLADWQIETGKDGASVSFNPLFVSPGDLHLLQAGNSILDNAGTNVAGITTDIDCENRNTTTPVIGADEFCSLTAVAITAQTNVSCFGGSNGSATLVPNGNDGPFTYNWAPSGGNQATATNLTANTYTITVGDATNCGITTVVTITEPSQLVAGINPGTIVCNGGTTTLNGTALGGTGAVTYQWIDGVTNGSVTINPLKDNTIYQANQSNSNALGTRIIAGNNGGGFAGRALIAFDIAANVPAGATITGTSLQLNCSQANPGSGLQLQSLHKLNENWGEGTSTATQQGQGVAATPNDATWLTSFFPSSLWATPGGTFNATSSGATTVGFPGLYTWTDPLMTADVQSWLNNPLNNFGWLLKGTESGPTQAKGYSSKEDLLPANRPALTINYSAPNVIGNTAILSNVAAGTYTLVVTDANGCTSTSSVTITQPAPVVASALASPSIICQGNSSTLSATGGVSYLWNPGALTGSPSVSPPATTSYTVTATDASGCTATSSVTVSVNTLPAITASPVTQTVCENSMATVTGGGGVSYTWTGGITNNTPFVVTATNTYTVTGTDANGCTNTATAEVLMNPAPIVTASATPSTTCSNTTVTPNATGPNLVWSGGLTNGVPFIATATNTYTVTGTDANNCSATSSVTVTVNLSSGILAPATSNQNQLHADDFDINYYNGNCDLIATINDGAGGNILGSTTATVNVDAGAGFHNGQPFVRRWYQISPASNGSADVVLYLNQSDFDDYNSVVVAPYLSLPATGNNADPAVANIRITKNDDAGLGNNPVVITPAVNWNGTFWELSFNTPGFSQFRIHSVNAGNVPLPVSILQFEGTKLQSSDLLSWTTGTEQNNAYFNLQHSADGIHFKTIATVNSKATGGNSQVALNYGFVNNAPVAGHNYYRLQQVDIDQNIHLHARVIDLIRGDGASLVNIYPNPTSDILNVELYTATPKRSMVKILDMSGRIIKQVQAQSVAGMNNITISLGDIAPGIYTVQVFGNEQLMQVGKVRKID